MSNALVSRAKEPSTWAGISTMLLAALQAFTMTGSKTAAVLAGLAAGAGGAAAVMPEKGSAPTTDTQEAQK